VECTVFTGMVCAECTVLSDWLGGNARFNRYDGCVMHGSTDIMGAGYKVLLEWLGGCTVQPV